MEPAGDSRRSNRRQETDQSDIDVLLVRPVSGRPAWDRQLQQLRHYLHGRYQQPLSEIQLDVDNLEQTVTDMDSFLTDVVVSGKLVYGTLLADLIAPYVLAQPEFIV